MLDLLTGGVLDDAHLANYQPLELLLLKVGHYGLLDLHAAGF